MDPLNEVCAHIDNPPDRGLTVEKIRDRGHGVDVTEEAIVFEVERHTSASGALYGDGLAMSTFVTYWPRYRYDRDTAELTALEERRPRTFECDYELLADELLCETFELRVDAQGDAWRCEERVGNREAVVAGVEDAQAFAEQLVRGWDLERVSGNVPVYTRTGGELRYESGTRTRLLRRIRQVARPSLRARAVGRPLSTVSIPVHARKN